MSRIKGQYLKHKNKLSYFLPEGVDANFSTLITIILGWQKTIYLIKRRKCTMDNLQKVALKNF
jgi:hypothetical protein